MLQNHMTELNKKLPFRLPENKIKDILYHSSYQPQDPSLLKQNKEYVAWGRSIISAAFAIYIYRNDSNINSATLNQKMASIDSHVIESIHRQYSLETFVIKSHGEINRNHPDIVPKLIAITYQKYGFIKVYEFLVHFFENAAQNENIDYKTLVQEYAQAKKLVPEYKIIDKTGPDHELIYTCQIRVGKQIATGSAIGKKKAEKEAAHQLITTYNITLVKPQNTKTGSTMSVRPISSLRKKQLDEAIGLLGIKNDFIQIHQLDEIFTHASYVNEHRDSRLNSNDRLGIVGAYLAMMLCGDYIFENYDIKNISLVKERGDLLRDENLAKLLPDTVTKYLLTVQNPELKNNAKAVQRLKIDILKSTLAALWINYLKTENQEIEQFTREFLYNKLSQASTEKILDYRTMLQEVVQQFGFTYTDEFKRLAERPNHDPEFVASIRVSGDNWIVRSSGSSGSKKSAVNYAAKDMLDRLQSRSPEVKKAIQNMLNARSSGSPVPYNQTKEDSVPAIATQPPAPTEEYAIIKGNNGVIAAQEYAGDETLISVVIDNQVRHIEEKAFHKCTKLTDIVIPNSVKHLGRNAFKSCVSLENIQLSSGLNTIMECTFRNCSNLKTISLPEGIREIRGKAFSGCKSLEQITFPSTLRQIEPNAFLGCDRLRILSLPDDMKSIDLSAFIGCSGLFELHMPATISTITNQTGTYPFYIIIAPQDSYAYRWAEENSFKVQAESQMDSIPSSGAGENQLSAGTAQKESPDSKEIAAQARYLMKRGDWEEAYQILAQSIANTNHGSQLISLVIRCILHGRLPYSPEPYLEMLFYGGNPNLGKPRPKYKKQLLRLYEFYRLKGNETKILKLFSIFPSAADLCKLSVDSVEALIYLNEKREAESTLDDLLQLGLMEEQEYQKYKLICRRGGK